MPLTPGYFPANYFTHNYWQLSNQYWTTAAAAAPAAAVGHLLRREPPLPLPRDILQLFHQYLRLKVNRYDN
jgi:hypothetical protein